MFRQLVGLGFRQAASNQRFGKRLLLRNRNIGRDTNIIPALASIRVERSSDRNEHGKVAFQRNVAAEIPGAIRCFTNHGRTVSPPERQDKMLSGRSGVTGCQHEHFGLGQRGCLERRYKMFAPHDRVGEGSFLSCGVGGSAKSPVRSTALRVSMSTSTVSLSNK